MKRFIKILKRVILAGIILGVLFVTLAVIMASRLEQKIGELFVREANKYLATEVTVGKISFSLLENFPLATLQLTDVYAKGSIKKQGNDSLLAAGQLNFNFNIIDLYRENYTIRRIDLKNARINLLVLKDYSDNYHIIKETDSKEETKFSFKLQRINLTDVKIAYRNYASGQYYKVRAVKSRWKGDFNQDNYELIVSGSYFVNEIKSGDLVYLANKSVELNTVIAVDQNRDLYEIKGGKIQLGELQLNLDAEWKSNETADQVDVRIRTENANLAEFISELPGHWKQQLDPYEADGNISLKIRLAGLFGDEKIPEMKMNFVLKDGLLKHKESGILLDKLMISGDYGNRGSTAMSDQDLKITTFSGMLGGNRFNGNLSLIGFKPSKVELGLNADLNAGEVMQFLGVSSFSKLEGTLKLNGIFSGNIDDFSNLKASDFIANTVNGNLEIENLTFGIKDYKTEFSGFNGMFSFSNNDIIAKKLSGKIDGMEFQTEAYLKNILPYLILDQEQLQIDAKVSSPFVDLYKLMSSATAGKPGEGGFPIPANTGFDIRFDIDKLNFKSFAAKSVDCALKYRNQKLFVNSLSMDAFGGSMMMTGQLDVANPDKMKVDCDASLTKADIKRLFREMGNFGQDYILDENLSGISDALIQLSFSMNRAMEIDPASILASIDLNITNGELINYKPIYGLGKFIRLDDLSRVRFSNLKNQILIKDRKMIIPEMEVQSDALNFVIAGTHSFDNEINYTIRLLLSEVLSRKAKTAKKENDEFGIEEPGKKGGTTLYILLTGTVDKPIFRYDSKGVKGKIISSVLNEKENLRSLFRKEFSRNKKEQDSILTKEKEQVKKQESGQYIMEFDGETIDTAAKKKQNPPKEKPGKKPVKAKEKQDKPVIKVDWE